MQGGKVTVSQSGSQLAAEVTGFSPAPTSVDYQWFVNDEEIPSATDSTFDTGSTDINPNDQYTVRVILHRTGHTDRLVAGDFGRERPTGLIRR